MNWLKQAKTRTISGKIVSCKTSDGLELHGIWKKNGSTALLHTHGTASSYGIEAFEPDLMEWAKKNGWSFLSCNNRGAHVLENWQASGAAVEKFSDCPEDFKAWIGWLQENGIERIILSGHSLGTEKIAHFVRNFEIPSVVGVLFLAPSDTPGCQERWEKKYGKNYIEEAIGMKKKGKEKDLLYDLKAHSGVLPMTAEAYLDFYREGSELKDSLPFRTGKIESLPVPVLALVPKKDEWGIKSAEEYSTILKNQGFTSIICDCDHDFNEFDLLSVCEKNTKLFD